jgi:peptidyl-prolyl cis-trans isomerase SDCCAG10
MQDDLRKLKKRTGNVSDSDSDDSTELRGGNRKGASYLEEELAKYSTGRGRAAQRAANKRGRRDEDEGLLLEMGKFSQKVAMADEGEEDRLDDGPEGGVEETDVLEVDDDVGWLSHKLKFEVDERELTRRAEDEYSVGRNPMFSFAVPGGVQQGWLTPH